MTALDPALLAFRPLRTDDLPQLHRWCHAPHAERWWGKGRSYEDIAAEYSEYIDGRVPIHAFVISHEGRDVGLMSWERFGDFPDLMEVYEVADPDASNCDVILGEPDVAHRGLGKHVILRFLRELVFVDPRITCCLIDPEVGNAIAIRAYEKAGFRFVRTVKDQDGAAIHLMELRREELG